MAFRLTSAADWEALLVELYDFGTGTPAADTDGTWTPEYSEDLAQRQIAMSKGNCSVALGAQSADIAVDRAPGTDTTISAALSSSINTANKQYWGPHADSLVTTSADSDRIRWNDLGETYNNVWMFSGTSPVSYIHCVVQTGERYTHLSFGIINPLGQTHPGCAFACATFYEWWSGQGDLSANNPADTDHKIGQFCEDGGNLHVYIPDGTVLPAVDYPAIGGTGTVFSGSQINLNMTRVAHPENHDDDAIGKILDGFMLLNNSSTTGGTPLWGLPVLFMESASGISQCWLGNLPGVRLVNILDHTPGETKKYGSEEWVVFPLKRKGALDEVQGKPNAIDIANSSKYGLAYLK